MKLLFYNIAYGIGIKGKYTEYMTHGWRYLHFPHKNLKNISSFIQQTNVDVACFIECDHGSVRSLFRNQLHALAKHADFPYIASGRKTDMLIGFLPTFHAVRSGMIARKPFGKITPHYLSAGVKRLVLEVEVAKGLSIFLVHLSLGKSARTKQVAELATMVKECKNKVILGGDFNTFTGSKEVQPLLDAGLHSLNVDGKKTFPAHNPKMLLDYVLVSKGVNVKKFAIPDVYYSDHLPLLVEVKE